MDAKIRKTIVIQLIIVVVSVGFFFGTMAWYPMGEEYSWDKIETRHEELGGAAVYGYTFQDYENFMHSPVKDDYLTYIYDGLDVAFVKAQWCYLGLDNDTLDTESLDNLTLYVNDLAAHGLQVVIHTWVSSYSPNWLYPQVPELVGKSDRWMGIDPDTDNATLQQQRKILKNSNVKYHQMLCDYFVSKGIDQHIRGFCLDDETQSEYWGDFFEEITDLLLTYNRSWRIGAMFNRYDKYKMTGDYGMTCNYMDPYNQDPEFIRKIQYAYQESGVDNISVLIDAMGGHEDESFHKKMRREAWISWFMGVHSIGWYTYIYPSDEWAVVKWNNGNGPIATDKTQTALDSKIDIDLLDSAYEKIYESTDSNEKSGWKSKLLEAYNLARKNKFDQARGLIQEVVDA